MAKNSRESITTNWRGWREFIEKRSGRPLPELDLGTDYSEMPASLARSLAIFQLGESGGGTIVKQAQRSELPGIDKDYAAALRLIVDEEHRHANMLAMSVRLLGGKLLHSNWTAKLFVIARRLIGLRLKVLVLLAAEVVGICYYSALADQLAPGPIQRWLRELVYDERAHLEFHCNFLRSQTQSAWKRKLFVAAWRTVMGTAAIVAMIDHRAAIRDMGLGIGVTWQRWMAVSQQAESFVTGSRPVVRQPSMFDSSGCPI